MPEDEQARAHPRVTLNPSPTPYPSFVSLSLSSIQAFVRAGGMDHNDPKLHVSIASNLIAQEDLPSAAISYGKAVALLPQNPQARYNYAELLFGLGNNAAAAEQFGACAALFEAKLGKDDARTADARRRQAEAKSRAAAPAVGGELQGPGL